MRFGEDFRIGSSSTRSECQTHRRAFPPADIYQEYSISGICSGCQPALSRYTASCMLPMASKPQDQCGRLGPL